MYAMQSAFTNPLHAGAEHEPARWRRCRGAARGRHVLGGGSLSLSLNLSLSHLQSSRVQSSGVQLLSLAFSCCCLASPPSLSNFSRTRKNQRDVNKLFSATADGCCHRHSASRAAARNDATAPARGANQRRAAPPLRKFLFVVQACLNVRGHVCSACRVEAARRRPRRGATDWR